ncbi:methyltransferase domain-containing protein [Asticcacaulis sp. EMRT-3]|uniref:methyltransferase domain-containing protein n=1 Tax=Asticcacaulis sp. EMRT-3 TaxID=3040349 RepID=UPI0024AF90D1|nr:methyltransferase domain-containing protein [Asticcacaulis sp. EMRT-3]MDI7773792.1 methyltransferase domain-containing protein [Asticcacaulis sp. EMRT-3]
MRRTVEDLNRFYASPEGAIVKRLIGNKLAEAWPDVRGLDLLGIGYCTPYLESCVEARRVLSAMPGGQGAEIWPTGLKVRTTLVEEEALPFPSALFDRIVMMHVLEESATPQGLLLEASRLLSPSGKLIIGVAARGGFWAHAEQTPFGYGQPYSRMQLEAALRDAELEPLAWSYALYAPPWRITRRWAGPLETILPAIWPMSGGLILMEAGRRPFVAQKRAAQKSLLRELRGALTPASAPVPTPSSRELENA